MNRRENSSMVLSVCPPCKRVPTASSAERGADSWRIRSLTIGLGLALCVAPSRAGPSSGDDDSAPARLRVLPPSTADVVRRAFGRAEPLLRLTRARIFPKRVEATVCAGAGCRLLVLTYPSPKCGGFVAGPWCVRTKGEALPPEHQSALRRALAGDAITKVWKTSSQASKSSPEDPRRPQTAPKPEATNALAYLLAVLYLIAPLGLGWGAGRLLRRRRKRGYRSGWAAVAFIGGFVALALLLVPFVRLALWDLLSLAVLLGAGAYVGASDTSKRWDRRNLALMAGSTLFSLLFVELALRWLVAPAPAFLKARDLTIMRDKHFVDDWAMIYPGTYPKQFRRLIEVPPDTRWRVIHVGDSMVYGVGTAKPKRFTSLLQGRVPHAAHLNAGVPGSGTDFHYLVIKRWLARMKAHHVVHYVFPTNDLVELDRPHEVCDDGSLLIYGRTGLTARCQRPPYDPTSLRARYFRSLYRRPAPYPLLVATSVSSLARHLCALQMRFRHRSHKHSHAHAIRHFTRIMRESQKLSRTQGVAYSIIILPDRRNLERFSRSKRARERTPHQDVVRICRKIAPRVFNAWDALLPLVRKHGGSRYFVDDIHFSAAGHRVMADWLGRRLAGTPGFGPARRAR